MYVYTQANILAAHFAGGAGFVGNAVFRAGNGCFGLTIQDDGSVQALFTLNHCALSAGFTWEVTDPVNVKGQANKPKRAILVFVKSNMPIHPFCFALKCRWIAQNIKRFEKIHNCC